MSTIAPSPQGTLTYLLTQGLTLAHLAHALGVTTDDIRAVIADPDAPLSEQAHTTLATLTAHKVAAANDLVAAEDVRTHIDLLTLDGCRPQDIETTLSLPPCTLYTTTPTWIDTTRGIGLTWGLTIEQVTDPKVPSLLTWGRLESLETMGWSRDDVEAAIGPCLPNGPDQDIPRAAAQSVLAYWQANSGRVNPLRKPLATAARARGTDTPAGWEPPDILWWPPVSLHHLTPHIDYASGPTPNRRH